jgi:hypothetical protein
MASTTQSNVLKDQFGNLLLGPSGNGQLAASTTPPVNPMEAAVGGAGPDAAKMAGTPAQTSAQTALPRPAAPAPNATRMAAPQGTQLRDVLRAEGAAPQGPTAQQADRAATAARYQQQFGDLGSRVQNLIATAIAPPPATTPAAPTMGDVSKLPANQQAAVQAYAANPTVDTYAAAKQALAGADPNQYIPASDSTAIAKQLATATPDKST